MDGNSPCKKCVLITITGNHLNPSNNKHQNITHIWGSNYVSMLDRSIEHFCMSTPLAVLAPDPMFDLDPEDDSYPQLGLVTSKITLKLIALEIL